METAHNHKIDEALHLLNQAAKEKKEDLQKLITEKYSHIRGAFSEEAAHGRESLRNWKANADQLMREGREKVSEAASELDQQVRKSPWHFIGGVAVGALVLGYLVGSSRSK